MIARALGGLDPDDVRGLTWGWRDTRTAGSFVVEQRALFFELPAMLPAIRRVAVLAAVVVGERDRVTRPRGGRELAAVLPDARMICVAGAGHLLPWQAPAVVASAIAQTMGRSQSRA